MQFLRDRTLQQLQLPVRLEGNCARPTFWKKITDLRVQLNISLLARLGQRSTVP